MNMHNPASKPIGVQSFGKFDLEQRIATGGMAEIYLARSSALSGVDNVFVIKRILPNLSADEYFINMFIDEARICVDLNHPNIVKTFDFGDVDGTYYIAMEYIHGIDVLQLLQTSDEREIRVPPDVAAVIARDMCRGLDYAHNRVDSQNQSLNIVHRDISPQNILLGFDGKAKVTDFGIASAKDRVSQTQEGTLKGKCSYMSPEQATTGILDLRSDIWASGVVLYELLIGDRLFLGETPLKTMENVCRLKIDKPHETHDDVSEELSAIVMNALSRNLKKRYQSAGEMADALDEYLSDRKITNQDAEGFLEKHDWQRDTLTEESGPPAPKGQRTAILEDIQSSDETWRQIEELEHLFIAMESNPHIWQLVDIGEVLLVKGHRETAFACFRMAAVLFTYRGLLVQALCATRLLREHLTSVELREDFLMLGRLRNRERRAFEQAVARVDHNGLWELVRSTYDNRDIGQDTSIIKPTPLFSALSLPAFIKLAEAVEIRVINKDEVIVQEGDSGDSLYAIGNGRVMVHCLPGNIRPTERVEATNSGVPTTESAAPDSQAQHIFLSSLSDGDFFGEFSYLTQAKRSATVQAHSDTVILEIGPGTATETLQADPHFTQPLLEFYIERVGHLMMAKNPFLGKLSSEQRRKLLTHSVIRKYKDRDFIVKHGEVSDEVYFVKKGELEVFREEKGISIFINKLSDGEFFGEIAAFQNTPRMANVQAMSDVEVISFTSEALFQVLADTPLITKAIEAEIEARKLETSDRIEQTLRIFSGT
jgi:serine/threonine protein kinase/CRP-like cAMP-binding protein